jgi:hypothetical protein
VPSHFPGGKTDNPDPVTKWPIEDETENCSLDAHSLELELYRIFINSLAPDGKMIKNRKTQKLKIP